LYILKRNCIIFTRDKILNLGVIDMAKNKPAFQSNNNKPMNGQVNKGANKTTTPTPKKPIRGNSRGQ
jgi:hypothetical protein